MDELNVFDENMRGDLQGSRKGKNPVPSHYPGTDPGSNERKKECQKAGRTVCTDQGSGRYGNRCRNQLVEKQFTEGEHTKTIENINPVLSENSKILEESTKQRRTSREENLLGKLMEASNQ